MHSAGLRGYLPEYICEFLKNRKFQVRVGNYLSEVKTQINGVSQGSILAVTLFALKINSVAHRIPKKAGFITSLYVDDLQIGYRHCNITEVGKEMQHCLTKVYKWAQSNGLIFSETKTKMMHFTTLPGLHINKPQLAVGNYIIPYTNSIKFLGMIWNRKLLWREPITKLKAECNKAIGLLRTVTTQK